MKIQCIRTHLDKTVCKAKEMHNIFFEYIFYLFNKETIVCMYVLYKRLVHMNTT